MTSSRDQYGIKLSILDRIITVQSGNRATIRDLEETLHRDLTALLNTRRADEAVTGDFAESSNSLLSFGLPDFTGCSALDRSEQERFRREIESAIRCFEPRLSNVTVSLERPSQKDARGKLLDTSLRYHIRALLRVEPEPEPVYFDAVLEPGSGRVELEAPHSKR